MTRVPVHPELLRWARERARSMMEAWDEAAAVCARDAA